jgi:beta-lactamase class A
MARADRRPRTRSLVGALGIAGAVVLTAIAVPVAPVGARAATTQLPAQARAGGCTESPFSAGFDATVRARWPGKRISAAVYDTRTGCQYRYRSDLRITTASVLKIEIMAAVLLRAQRAGRALTSTERARIGPMIRTSDDPSANALWSSVGGTSGLAALDRELGLDDTRQTSPWGLTSTSAADRNELLRQLVLGQWGPFSTSTRAAARSFLLDVAPSQRWGITAGVPTSWRVPLKNGFFPATCCGWRINTSGVVERPGGGAYVATVLSDGWPNQAAGVAAVEFVSKVIASWNLADIGPHRSAGRFARQSIRDVLGRTASFSEEQDSAWRVGADPARAGGELARLLGDPQVDATSNQIIRLYLGALGRLPEASVWSGRVAQVRVGTRSIGQVADSIAWSSELSGARPLTTAEFVDRAHERVHGRRPSATDRAWWVRRIDGGVPRGALLVELIGTSTFRWRTWQDVKVAGSTLAVLRRSATSAELARWVPALWAGTPYSSLTAEQVASAGYRARFS